MTIPQQILTIVAVVLGTMTTRFLPFLFFPEGKEPPAFVRYLGAVLPSAVIGLLVVFCLKDAVFTGWHGLPEAIAICGRGRAAQVQAQHPPEHRRRDRAVYVPGADGVCLIRFPILVP